MRPGIRWLPTLVRLEGLLLQPADPCVLVAIVHTKLRNFHLLLQQQFKGFVDKGPKHCHCKGSVSSKAVASMGCFPNLSWRVTLENSWSERDLVEHENWEIEKKQVSWAKQRCWLESLFGLMLLSEE
jgi:hypothetical protein